MPRPTLRTLALGALLLSAVALASPALAGPPDVRVPRVVDQDLERATRLLAERGLEAHVKWSALAAPGRVAQQDPRPGALVRAGDAVEIVAGLRIPVDTVVPDIVGMAEAEAVRGLEPVYEVDVVEVPVGRDRDGLVVAQDPVAGARLAFRGPLRLSIGREGLDPEVGTLPHVVGMDLGEAEQRLLDLGFVPHPVFVPGRTGPAWSVLRQDPPTGAALPAGSEVRLEVARSRGWGYRGRVPGLYGLSVEDATRALESLGLVAQVTRTPSVFERETVLRTSPGRGETVARGATVRLVAAVPARRLRRLPRVQVPSLRHLDLHAVRAAVRDAGLRLAIRRVVAPERPAEQVIAQLPRAGASTPLGAVVRVDLPKIAEVPRLIGLRADAARQGAAALGFAVHFEGDQPQGRRGGARVVDQHPAAGSLAAVGTTLRAVLRGRHGGRAVEVPDLTGLSGTVAKTRLREIGLEGLFTGPRLPITALLEVVTQDPAPGTRLAPGSTVRATLGLRREALRPAVRVPDLAGLSLLAAQQRLEAVGLTARASFVRGPGPQGVAGQVPAAGTRVPRGSEVRITVRRGR